jgi:hypothetical protein
MALQSTDLKLYGSANMPTADTGTCGGAIDTTTRVVFDDTTLPNAMNSKVRYYSSLASDNYQMCIVGRDVGRILASESIALNGASHVSGTLLFSEILVCSGNHNGTITFQDQTTQTTFLSMESGVNAVRKPFYNLQFTTAGKTAYEKVFLKNTNTTEVLQNAWLLESADPSGKLTFALASGQNDNASSTNRLTAPTYIMESGFSSLAKPVPGTNLNAGSGIGIWVQTTLTGTECSFKSTYTIQASGLIFS